MLEGFEGVLQVDGYGGYNRLADDRREHGAPLRPAYRQAHARREIVKAAPKAGSPIAEEALTRIAALYGHRERHPRPRSGTAPRRAAGAIRAAAR
jgi:transposase